MTDNRHNNSTLKFVCPYFRVRIDTNKIVHAATLPQVHATRHAQQRAAADGVISISIAIAAEIQYESFTAMPPSGSSGPPTRRPGNQASQGGGGGFGGANRPLYAIDFTAVACGKRIANTKRRVRWRFGFANPEALEAGATGIACRGEEHDVTMVWSITSGKRLILADGQEVHYSSSRSAVIDFSWTMRGNHVLKVVAHATTPMTVEPGFRQYDFFVDGRSFFSFPKVYRLGLTGGTAGGNKMDARSPRGGGFAESSGRMSGPPKSLAQIEAPHNPDEVRVFVAVLFYPPLLSFGQHFLLMD